MKGFMPHPNVLDDDLADTELIRRVAALDRKAFEILYERYRPRVYRYLSSQIRQPEIIEETVDDVMMVVWETASRFNGTSAVSTWILGIAHYKALKGRARAATVDAGFQETSPAEFNTNSPDAYYERRELTDVIMRALDTLPPEQRAVVELTYYHDLSYREIGEILKCPVNTVKTRMLHARQRLALLFPADPSNN